MLYEIMNSRRSIRKFKPEKPDRETILKLIEAAVTAPSGHNRQPWRFVVVSDAEVISKLAAAVHDTFSSLSNHVIEKYKYRLRVYEKYFTKFENAPTALVPLYQNITVISGIVSEDLPDAERESVLKMEKDLGLVSASLAVQNILLAAHENGLGACIMSGPLVAPDEIREILDIGESWEPLAIIPIGFPDEDPNPPKRNPVEDVITWID
ncbi:MAG: nitroreductase family protein [Planctomycetota bacterium]|jgi:F420 biosynthesis protein FbiB-like protein